MGLLDGILGQMGSNMAIEMIAQKVGIPPALAEKAVAALGREHPEPNNTIEAASARTGLDAGTLAIIVNQLGGEGGLGQLSDLIRNNPQAVSSVLGMLDRDGDGNPLDDLAGIAGGLLGKK